MITEEKIKTLKAGVDGLLDKISDKSEPYFCGQAIGLHYVKELIDNTFPELKESEDEKIREALIGHFRTLSYDLSVNGFSKEDFIAYLEKQKEQKIACWKSLGECSDIPDGHYVVGWFRFGDFRLGIMCNGLFVDPNGNRVEQPKEVFYIPNADEEFVYAEQKPAEWSEEADKVVPIVYKFIRKILDSFGVYSEEEELIDSREALLCYFSHDCAEEIIEFLHPQPQWKPSEEQMSELYNAAIMNAVPWPSLKSLYNDLKKL